MDSWLDEGGSYGTTGLVGTVAGVVMGGASLTALVVVVVMCILRKNRREIFCSTPTGVSNTIYDIGECEDDDKRISLDTLDGKTVHYSSASPSTAGNTKRVEDLTYMPTPKLGCSFHPYEHIDNLTLRHSQEYSYAVRGAEIFNTTQQPLNSMAESVYEVPASDEDSLNAQMAKIRINIIPPHSVQITEVLGSGQFGTVSKGVWHSPNGTLEVAVKMLKSSATGEDRIKFLQEGAIMGQFKHPNVVKLHGIVREREQVLLVIELLAKSDLREYLLILMPDPDKAARSDLPHTLLSFCRQVASGMDYLSKKGFVHRDLAARNILISEDLETLKIADFGMSRDLADETYYISRGGKIPVKWTAPEALHFKKYSTASDVWSFGCLMYEIWSLGHKPFEGFTNSEVIRMVGSGIRLSPPPGCPRAVYGIMIACWHPTTSDRLSFPSIVQSLSRSDLTLLKWKEEDRPASSSHALLLGAPLEAARALHGDLNKIYLPESTSDDYDDVS